jgi:hypothetical protein
MPASTTRAAGELGRDLGDIVGQAEVARDELPTVGQKRRWLPVEDRRMASHSAAV